MFLSKKKKKPSNNTYGSIPVLQSSKQAKKLTYQYYLYREGQGQWGNTKEASGVMGIIYFMI